MELALEQDAPRCGLQGSETGGLEVNRMLTAKVVCDGDTEKMSVDSADNIPQREMACHDAVTCDNGIGGQLMIPDELDKDCDADAEQNCVSSESAVPTCSAETNSDENVQNDQLFSDSLNENNVNQQVESLSGESKTENRLNTSTENCPTSAKTANQCSHSPRELHLNATASESTKSTSDKCDKAMHKMQPSGNECNRNSELLSALLKPERTLAKSDSLKTVVNTMVEVGMWMPLNESNGKPVTMKTQDSSSENTQPANDDSIQNETKEAGRLLSDEEHCSVICTSAESTPPCTSVSTPSCSAGTASQSGNNVNKTSEPNSECTDTGDVSKKSSGEDERPSSSRFVNNTSDCAASSSSSVDMSEQTCTTSTLSNRTVANPGLANIDTIITTVIRGRDQSSPIVVWTTEEDISVGQHGSKPKGDMNVISGTDNSSNAKNQNNEDGIRTDGNVMSSINSGMAECENSSMENSSSVKSSAAAAGNHLENSAVNPGICHSEDDPEENECPADSAVDPVVIAPAGPGWCNEEQTAATSSLPQICQVFGGMTGSKLQQLHTQGSIGTKAEKSNEVKQQHSLLKSILRSANKASMIAGIQPKDMVSSQEEDCSEAVTPEKTMAQTPGTVTVKEEKLDAGYPDEPPLANPEEQLVRYVGYKNILPAPSVDGNLGIQSTISQNNLAGKQPAKTVVSTTPSKMVTSQQGNLTSLLQNQAVGAKTMLLSKGMLTNVSGVVGKVVRNGTGNLQVAVPLLVSKAGSHVVGQPPVLFTFASLPKSSDSSVGASAATTVQPVVTNVVTQMTGVSNKSKPATPKQAAGTELDSDYSRYLRHVIKFKTEIKSLKDTNVKYTCPMPPSSLFLSHKMNRMYVCRGCDSTFHKQSTLSEHQLRRSMTLRYSCDTNCHVLFYNVCQLILHTRNHPPKRPDWQERVVIYGLSEDLMSSTGPQTYADVKKAVYKAAGMKGTKQIRGQDEAAESSGTKKKQLQRHENEDADVLHKTEPADHCYGRSDRKTPNKNGKSSSKTSPKKGSICAEQRVNTMLDGKPVLCTECGLMFKNSSDLMMHMINYGSNDALCLCKTCPVILRSKCAHSAHARIHKNSVPYVCPECGQVIHGSHNVFWKHLHVKCVHHIRQALFRCSFCRKQFRDQKRLILHTTNQHSTKFYKCQLCPMAFKVAAGVSQHAKANHNGKVLQKIIYKCPFCVAVYRDDTYTAHIEQHLASTEFRVVYKCNACSKSFEKRSLCINHMTQVHKFYFNHNHMCHICGTDFRLASSLVQHQADEHPNIPELDNALTRCLRHSGVISCNDESPSLGSPAGAGSPQDNERQQPSDRPLTVLDIKEEPTDDDEGNGDDDKRFHCSRCQMTMANAEQYRKHMGKHKFLEKKRFHGKGVDAKCGVLKRSRDNSSDLVLKIKLPKLGGNSAKEQKTVFTKQVPGAPDPEPTYYCSECNRAFYAEEGLAAHLKKEHNQDRQFPCHLCGKTYTDQSALRFHVKKLHEGWSKEKPYVCWICQEKDIRRCFPKRQLLIRHISKEHKIARNMIDYSKMPNPDNDYSKVDASPGQTSPSTIDGEQDTASDKQSEADIPPVKRLKLEGESSFSCAKCSFFTEDRTAFVAHIERHQPSKLTDAKLCLECGLSFTVTQSLKRHLLLVHQIRNFNKYMEESGLDLVSQPEEQDVIMPKTTANPQPDKISRPRSFVDSKQYVYKRNQKDEEHNELECTVCYRAYDDELELRAHMRTHGMAYIRSSRRTDDL